VTVLQAGFGGGSSKAAENAERALTISSLRTATIVVSSSSQPQGFQLKEPQLFT
jgi:hypothetical protein